MKYKGVSYPLIIVKARVAGWLHLLFPFLWNNQQVVCIRPFHHQVSGNKEVNCCCYHSSNISIQTFLANHSLFRLQMSDWQRQVLIGKKVK